jgi:YfiH family protein
MHCTVVDSVPVWQFELLARFDALVQGVSTRWGGVSEGRYAELNIGLHVGDDEERVVENRRRFCRALGVRFESCTFAQQVHGSGLHLVAASDVGAGGSRFEEGIPAADGLVVTRPGVVVAAVVADCVPIVIYDPDKHAAAAVHAGWRGTAAGIAAKAVEVLVSECGSGPDSIVAGIGPAIGGCCYEVSEDAVEGLRRGFAGGEPVAEERDGRWYADLAEANRWQLRGAGLRAENVELAGICTSCRSDEFYSERTLGRPTGRFGLFVGLR